MFSDGTSTNDIIASRPSQKKIKKRPAEIADINDDSPKEKTAVRNIDLEGNKDHLETKKQIESLRKQYGDSWLRSEVTMVHEVLGMKNEGLDKSYSSEQMIQSLLEETGAVPKNVVCSTSTPNKLPQNISSTDLTGSDEVSIFDCRKRYFRFLSAIGFANKIDESFAEHFRYFFPAEGSR